MADTLPADVRDLLVLNLVPGLGPRLTAALLERLGSPGAVLRAPVDQLAQVPHIGPKLADDFHEAIRRIDVAAEVASLEKHRTSLLALGTPAYPEPLSQVADPPHLLYARGRWEPRDSNAVAVVGSRHCTAYGRRVAQRLAAELARAGFTVVSGLARGIDAAAHRGALEAGGRTLAVLAGGLSRIYPPEHEDLAAKVEAAGALLSEAPMAMEPLAGMFPARNRLISGLSRGVVVVEAAERSGALITARHAGEQGRTVCAVPGPVDSAASAGSNRLLRDGATLVRHAEDVIEELDGILPASPAPTAEPPRDLDGLQRRIWESLAAQPLHVDELAQRLAAPVPQLTGPLLTLEMKRVIRRLSGNRYERT
jgi:DNA processing protein